MRLPIAMISVALLATPALAQAPAQPAPQVGPAAPVDPKACAPGERGTVGTGQPHTAQTPQDGAPPDNLSDKLARTDGVICPPEDVDPEIRAPAPGGGRTPVIPPPGSPGGDPTVRPK